MSAGAPTRFAWLSVAAALLTMGLKAVAYGLTGSVTLLSDALESIVNLVAAVVALLTLRYAAAPADEQHPHGHEKAEYFSSGLEGALICAAAAAIVWAAVARLLDPRALTALDLGLGISVAASLVNLVVARVLKRAAVTHRSIVLAADAEHLMTDVWTSAGVLVGLLLVRFTGWLWLDPLAAILVALHISWVGAGILRASMRGLLDAALPSDEISQIRQVLAGFERDGIAFHALRTRSSGSRRFVSVHVLVPGAWTVQAGHDLLERVERALRETAPKTTVITHLEPREDPCSYDDQSIDD